MGSLRYISVAKTYPLRKVPIGPRVSRKELQMFRAVRPLSVSSLDVAKRTLWWSMTKPGKMKLHLGRLSGVWLGKRRKVLNRQFKWLGQQIFTWPRWSSKWWTTRRTACHRPNTKTISCTARRMDTMFGWRVSCATNSSGKPNGPLNQPETLMHRTYAYRNRIFYHM